MKTESKRIGLDWQTETKKERQIKREQRLKFFNILLLSVTTITQAQQFHLTSLCHCYYMHGNVLKEIFLSSLDTHIF